MTFSLDKILFTFLALAYNISMGFTKDAIQPDTVVHDEHVMTLRIDPSSAVGGDESELFDSVRYIPLETNKESEFSQISQLEITDDYYIIFDGNLNIILFFNKDGSFHKKITAKNKDIPIDFKFIDRFTVDKENDLLSFNDLHSPYFYEFNLNGDFIRTIEKKVSTGSDFSLFNNLKIQYYRFESTTNNESQPNIIIYDSDGKKLNAYLYFDIASVHYLELYGVPKYFYRSNGQLYFTHPYDYSVYSIDTFGSLHKLYNIILPAANTLPPDFLSNSIYKNKRMDFTKDNPSVVYALRDFYQTGDWVSLKAWGSKIHTNLSYNLTTGELYDLRELISTNLGIELSGYSSVLGVDGKALVSDVFFGSLKKRYDEAPKEIQNKMPEQLRNLMDKEFHNPILKLSYFK